MSLNGFQSLPLPLVQLSLAAVLKCGQSFRWSVYPVEILVTPKNFIGNALPPTTDDSHLLQYEYRLCLSDRVVCLRQNATTLFYRSIFPPKSNFTDTQKAAKEEETLNWVKDYFQLEVDLKLLYEEWAGRDKVFASIRHRFGGIRILRQDPWENLISFICSANNNIVRISKMVNRLCKDFSPPLLAIPKDGDQLREDTGGEAKSDDEVYYPFPPPSMLAGPDVAAKLRTLGFGYRAEYIQRTAKMLVDIHGLKLVEGETRQPAEIWLKTLRDLSTNEAREELLKFVGVGRKVADCILLMSMNKHDVVPVDTHVYQIAMKYYNFGNRASGKKVNMTPKLYDQVATRLLDTWGTYAGWAHSVLFTADLKAFAEYGLDGETTETVTVSESQIGVAGDGVETVTKRKWKVSTSSTTKVSSTRPLRRRRQA